jgi:hypothetical protein
MRWLVKIGFPCHTLTVLHCDTKGRTSDHETVHPLRHLLGRTSFSLHYPAYSLTLKANKGSLRPPNIDRNLHAK